MKYFRKPVLVRSLLSCAILALVACGGGDNDGKVKDLRSGLNQTREDLAQAKDKIKYLDSQIASRWDKTVTQRLESNSRRVTW